MARLLYSRLAVADPLAVLREFVAQAEKMWRSIQVAVSAEGSPEITFFGERGGAVVPFGGLELLIGPSAGLTHLITSLSDGNGGMTAVAVHGAVHEQMGLEGPVRLESSDLSRLDLGFWVFEGQWPNLRLANDDQT